MIITTVLAIISVVVVITSSINLGMIVMKKDVHMHSVSFFMLS